MKLRSELTYPYPQNADVHGAQIQTPRRQGSNLGNCPGL